MNESTMSFLFGAIQAAPGPRCVSWGILDNSAANGETFLWVLKISVRSAAKERIKVSGLPEVRHACFHAQKSCRRALVSGAQGTSQSL